MTISAGTVPQLLFEVLTKEFSEIDLTPAPGIFSTPVDLAIKRA